MISAKGMKYIHRTAMVAKNVLWHQTLGGM